MQFQRFCKEGATQTLKEKITLRLLKQQFIGVVLSLSMVLSSMVFSCVSMPATQVFAAETASDYYSVAVSFSAEKVEKFAKKVRANILAQDWEALSKQIAYPVRVGSNQYKTAKEFLAHAKSGTVSKDFLDMIEKETCTKMACNSQGVMLGSGYLWLSERVSGSKNTLKIISMVEFIDDAASLSKPTGITWKKVTAKMDDAAGIKYTKKNVSKNAASVYFQDHGDIKLKVRAYKNVDGKKVYGPWASSLITQKDADAFM